MRASNFSFTNSSFIRLVFSFAVLLFAGTVHAQTNLDMEAGNFSGWSGTHGYNANSNAPFVFVNSGITYNTDIGHKDCSFYELITPAYGNDHYGNFPGVCPDGGSFSARIGSEWMNEALNAHCTDPDLVIGHCGAEEIHQSFVVTAANVLLTYRYAVVLNDGASTGNAHVPGEQPYFQATVEDSVGNPLSFCTYYNEQVVSGIVPTDYLISDSVNNTDRTLVYYLPWTTNTINLSAYIGRTVTIKFASSGCNRSNHFSYAYVEASTGPLNITVTPNPCIGGTAVCTAPSTVGGFYNWSGPGIVGTSNTQTVTVNTSGTYTVNITPAQGPGCAYSLSIPVTFHGPAAIPSASGNVSCFGGNNGSAVANVTGGAPAYTYAWSPSGGSSSAASNLIAGNYSVTVSDALGCTTTATVAITEPADLTVPISASPSCNTPSGTATVSPTGGGGVPYTYQWDNGQTNQVATALTGGNSYSVIVTSANGCTKTNSVTIATVTSTPTISGVTAASYGCSSPYGIATVNAYGGSPAYNYNWSPGGQTTATVTGLAAGNYSVVVTDANNCSASSTVSVTLTMPPSVTATSTQAACGNNNGTATAIPSGGTPGYSYTWSTGQTTASIANLAPGNYSVSIIDNSCNMSGIELVTNGNFNAGNLGFSSGYTVCSTANCLVPEGFYAVGTDPYFYHPSWCSCPDHTSASGNFMIVNGAGTPGTNVWCQTITVSPNTHYIFSTWVMSIYTISPAQLQFYVNGVPLGSVFSAPGTCCSWQQFFANWNSGSVTTADICVVNQNNTLSGNDFGLDDISFQSCTPCMATTTVAVTPAPVLSSSVTATPILCSGGTTTITASASAGNPGYTYNWNNAQTGSVLSGVPAGSYSVTITDSLGCTALNSVTVSQPTPVSTSVSGNDSICLGDSTILTANASGGTPAYTYVWTPGPQSGPFISVSPNSPTTYSVVTTDSSGCMAVTQVFNVNIIPGPHALFDTLSNGAYGETYSFSDMSNGGTTSWYWMFGDGTTSTDQNPIHTFPGAGSYTVTQVVFNQSGCPDTFRITMKLPEGLIVPNVFSPDGDGINDVWYVPNSGMTEFHLSIYDRWGLTVFETRAPEIRWDGYSSAGKALSDGTYYYVLEAFLRSSEGNKDTSTKGYVTLLTNRHK